MAKKAPYLDTRDLALRIMSDGFTRVKSDVGERLNPIRATKIVKMLRDEYGYGDKSLDRDLVKLANSKRPGHLGGPVKPPEDGEVREYKVGNNGRIGVPLGILGKGPGDTARVRYGKKQIVISSR